MRSLHAAKEFSIGNELRHPFGEKAECTQMKEAFQHWNIDKGSTFVGQDQKELDPMIYSITFEMAKAISAQKNA